MRSRCSSAALSAGPPFVRKLVRRYSSGLHIHSTIYGLHRFETRPESAENKTEHHLKYTLCSTCLKYYAFIPDFQRVLSQLQQTMIHLFSCSFLSIHLSYSPFSKNSYFLVSLCCYYS